MSARASEIVLVVEDEPFIRMNAADFLSDAGFEVMEAGNATEAIAILERRRDIRLVFTDINMPHGIDGLKLAALIRDRWPPIEIVVTSGNVHPVPGTLPARCVFVAKPYRLESIAATLRGFAS